MRRLEAWHYLIGVFVLFWALFAFIIISTGFPFMVIMMALTVLAGLSALVVVLAWAFQHNL
ncbi:MAG TPA: hypothetical protein VKR06_14245 [Ktedonosporobacter sp.]|nr:hypothetical protein [Ktedonosporobacter sp.]